MRTTRWDLDRGRELESSEGHAVDQRRLWRACKGVQALTSPGSRKKIWEEVLSLSICLSIYLSTNNKLWALFENKRDIFFIKKCFVRSLKLVNQCYDNGYTTISLISVWNCVTLPLRPPHVTSTFLTISLLYSRWSTSGPDRGNAHFLPLHQIQSREWEEREQTNKHLGLTQEQKES